VTPRSRSPSRSRSRSSTPSSNIARQAEEEEVDKFDFDETVNTKRIALSSTATDEKDKSEVNDTDNDSLKAAGKKPFINGIDMFADELHIEAENYNVSFNNVFVSFICFKNIIFRSEGLKLLNLLTDVDVFFYLLVDMFVYLLPVS